MISFNVIPEDRHKRKPFNYKCRLKSNTDNQYQKLTTLECPSLQRNLEVKVQSVSFGASLPSSTEISFCVFCCLKEVL